MKDFKTFILHAPLNFSKCFFVKTNTIYNVGPCRGGIFLHWVARGPHLHPNPGTASGSEVMPDFTMSSSQNVILNQHHLGYCKNSELSQTTPDLTNHKLRGGPSSSNFYKSFRGLSCMLKFAND